MQVTFSRAVSPAFKAIVIGAIVIALLVPLSMLEGLVQEREVLREAAYVRVAEGWGGALKVGGPVLVVPTESQSEPAESPRVDREDLYLLPTSLDIAIDTAQEPEPRYVGLYEVPVFTANIRITGAFDLANVRRELEARHADRRILWHQARLRLPTSDLRGLRELSNARFGTDDLTISPGTHGPFAGLESAIASDGLREDAMRQFEFVLRMGGSRELAVLPVGSTTRATVRSDWPHPAFRGAYLPAERVVTPSGFEARWQILELNRTYGGVLSSRTIDEAKIGDALICVGFHQPVDIYQRGERAIKYALLFIALTFMTVFAWEHVTGMSLHPLQYLLVGFALSIFYLLLIALSEHLAFVYAYWIAATALVLLIGVYLAGALRSPRRGWIAAAALLGTYAISYFLIISESYALLMGSIVLFTALGILMTTTRHVDWYAITRDRGPEHGA